MVNSSNGVIIAIILFIIGLFVIIFLASEKNSDDGESKSESKKEPTGGNDLVTKESFEMIMTMIDSTADNSAQRDERFPFMDDAVYRTARDKMKQDRYEDITELEWQSIFSSVFMHEAVCRALVTPTNSALYAISSQVREKYIMPRISQVSKITVYYGLLRSIFELFEACVKTGNVPSGKLGQYMSLSSCRKEFYDSLEKMNEGKAYLIEKDGWKAIRAYFLGAEDCFSGLHEPASAYILREIYRDWIIPNGGIKIG